jgi:hypothetical protein
VRGFLILIALLLLTAVAAPVAAQTERGNRVTQVGYEGHFEPGGWIPLRAVVSAPGDVPGPYILRVICRDLDGDTVTYDRTFTLSAGGGQEVWTYFKLPRVGTTLSPAEDLAVVLTSPDGQELQRLALPNRPVEAVDRIRYGGGPASSVPGRLMLVVGGEGGGFFPGVLEFSPEVAGLTGINVPLSVSTDDLPDRAIGYDAIHTVVWQNADPTDLLAGGGAQMQALRAWLVAGGRLVVTHPGDWQSLEPIFDLLPVDPVAAIDLPNLLWLRRLAVTGDGIGPPVGFATAPGPFRFVLASAKPEAMVTQWLLPDEVPQDAARQYDDVASAGRFPLAVSGGYGFGHVSWLATNLGNTAVAGSRTAPTAGWASIWSHVIGTGDRPVLDPSESQQRSFRLDATRDIASGPESATGLVGKGAALVTLAIAFFIGYWLLAGPGAYFLLLRKKKTHLSWWTFGATAVAAAGLTVLLTSLILRGPAEVVHVTLDRLGPDTPRVIKSDLGIYIPRDGLQTIAAAADATLSGDINTPPPTLTPLTPPRRGLGSGVSARTNPATYHVPLDASATVDVPYRSTLKKLNATVAAPAVAGIEGNAALTPGSQFPVGQLVNTSGSDLVNVHIVYAFMRGTRREVMVLYAPQWQNGLALPSLAEVYRPTDAAPLPRVSMRNTRSTRQPTDAFVWGELRNDWAEQYWFRLRNLRENQLAVAGGSTFDDWDRPHRATPVMLSLFDLLPPMRAGVQGGDSVGLVRPGRRDWDVSAAVMAGNLVIIGETEQAPTPLPLEVNGRSIGGEGTVIHQFVLPLDRTQVARAEAAGFARQQEDEALLEEAEREEPAASAEDQETPSP